MKKTIITLCLFLLTIIGKAQAFEFAPVGAEWYYTRYYRVGYNLTGIACDKFTSLRSVEINGVECKEIELYRHLNQYGTVEPYTEVRYIHQEGDRIYEVEDGEMYLLYDFSKEPGEYWVVPKYNDTIRVGSVSYMTLDDGTTRKVMETGPAVNYDLHFYYVIEGIGMDVSLFPFYYLDGNPWLEGPLRCYFEDGAQLISSETECDYEVLSVDELELNMNAGMVSYPNPTKRTIRIETENMRNIAIYNNLGERIFETETSGGSFEYDFGDGKTGLYIVKVRMSDGSEFSERIIKE